jgi:hypothetical protein
VAAVLITSTLFGLAHLSNANASAFSTINTILAGVWLGVAYLMTRSLWFATALHYSWNLAMAFVFGLPVSGISMFNQLAWLRPQDRPPEWVSGGSYGPEGGAAATLVLLLSRKRCSRQSDTATRSRASRTMLLIKKRTRSGLLRYPHGHGCARIQPGR